MGTLLSANVDKQAMLPAIEMVVKNWFHNPADAFYTGTVMDILFNGVIIDCSADDKLTTALCMALEETVAFQRVDDGHLAFTFFGGVSWQSFNQFLCIRLKFHILSSKPITCNDQVNNTDLGVFKVLRGKKNYKDIGRVLEFNGDKGDLLSIFFFA